MILNAEQIKTIKIYITDDDPKPDPNAINNLASGHVVISENDADAHYLFHTTDKKQMLQRFRQHANRSETTRYKIITNCLEQHPSLNDNLTLFFKQCNGIGINKYILCVQIYDMFCGHSHIYDSEIAAFYCAWLMPACTTPEQAALVSLMDL